MSMDIETRIGGAYEMPDGRKFWIDAPVAREIVRRMALLDPNEEVAFWRRDAVARLQMAIWLHRGCEQRGEEDRAAHVRVDVLRPTLAALRDADAREWHERCASCNEFLRPGEQRVSLGDDGGAAHAKCNGGQGFADVRDDDAVAVIAEARAIIADPPEDPAP